MYDLRPSGCQFAARLFQALGAFIAAVLYAVSPAIRLSAELFLLSLIVLLAVLLPLSDSLHRYWPEAILERVLILGTTRSPPRSSRR
jgi:hypothetical protein